MEEFQRVDVFFHLDDRTVEGERVIDNLPQRFCFHVFSEESIGYRVGYLLKRQVGDIVKELFGQLFDILRHVETAVFGQAFNNCFLKCGYGSHSIGAVVFHIG